MEIVLPQCVVSKYFFFLFHQTKAANQWSWQNQATIVSFAIYRVRHCKYQTFFFGPLSLNKVIIKKSRDGRFLWIRNWDLGWICLGRMANFPAFIASKSLTYETIIYLKWNDIICGTFSCIKKIYDNLNNVLLCKPDWWFTEQQ